jgi:hypothetical protein
MPENLMKRLVSERVPFSGMSFEQRKLAGLLRDLSYENVQKARKIRDRLGGWVVRMSGNEFVSEDEEKYQQYFVKAELWNKLWVAHTAGKTEVNNYGQIFMEKN